MILQTVSCLLSRLPSSRFSRKHSIDRKIGGSPYSILWRKSASLLSSRVREGTARSATRSYKVLTLCWFTADFFLVSQAWKRGARKFFFWRENEKNLAPQRKKVARILQKSGSAFSPFHARDFHPLLRLSRISSKYFSKSNRGTEWRILATPHPDYW